MIVATAGKGGAGKTTIAATVSRLLARSGQLVVAVDADSNPNLAAALGIPNGAAANLVALPSTLVSRRLHGPALTEPLDVVVERYAQPGPDGVRLLMMGAPGHADTGCLCAAHATVSAVLADLRGRPGTVGFVDMEASPEHVSRGTARHADLLLLVAEPYYRSLESARRLAALAAELPIPRIAVVANKVRSAADREAIAAFCDRHGLELLGAVPWSDDVVAADARAVPLLDSGQGHEVVEALERLAGELGRGVGVPA